MNATSRGMMNVFGEPTTRLCALADGCVTVDIDASAVPADYPLLLTNVSAFSVELRRGGRAWPMGHLAPGEWIRARVEEEQSLEEALACITVHVPPTRLPSP